MLRAICIVAIVTANIIASTFLTLVACGLLHRVAGLPAELAGILGVLVGCEFGWTIRKLGIS